MPSASQPGYVYVLAHPALADQFKVGRTYRPPQVRAQELSRTAWPTPLEVVHARFFWDSVQAERDIHLELEPHGRQREFFTAPLDHIRRVVQAWTLGSSLRRHGRRGLGPGLDDAWADRVIDSDSWGFDLDRRDAEWEQAEIELASTDERTRAAGWRRGMRLSAEGWAEGSRRLAEQILRHCPGAEGARRASWVMDAAGTQGLVGAHLRAVWLRSWGESGDLDTWRQCLAEVWRAWCSRDWDEWPEMIRDTLTLERDLTTQLTGATQARRIQAATGFGGWDRVPPAERAP